MKKENGRLTLDSTDVKILETLQAEGRVTKLHLAQRVNLSPAACWDRLHQLETEGVIADYRAQVDLSHVTGWTEVWTEFHHASDQFEARARFEEAIRDTPEAIECWNITGDSSYLVRFMVNDAESYRALLDQLHSSELGIEKYTSHFVLRRVKRPVRIPIKGLLKPVRV